MKRRVATESTANADQALSDTSSTTRSRSRRRKRPFLVVLEEIDAGLAKMDIVEGLLRDGLPPEIIREFCRLGPFGEIVLEAAEAKLKDATGAAASRPPLPPIPASAA